MPYVHIRDVKEVIRRLRNRGILFEGNKAYPAIPTIDDSIESHTHALRALREAVETHERRNSRAALDSFVRLYELEDVLGGFVPGETGGGGGGGGDLANCAEADAGAPAEKIVDVVVGACSYDRKRVWGQHAAGKGTQVQPVSAVAGVITLDCHDSNVFEITFDQNLQIADPINPIDGQTINVFLKQDATGSRTVTSWGSAWTFFNGEPILSTAPNAVDMLSCQYDDNAGKWRCSFLTGFTTGVVGSGVPYTLANVGAGAEVYKQTIDELGTDVAQLRSLVGGTGIAIDQNTDDITIRSTLRVFVQATEPTSPQVGDLWFW